MRKMLVLGLWIVILIQCSPEILIMPSANDADDKPIIVSSKRYPVFSAARVVSKLVPGRVIGSHYEGLLRTKSRDYYAEGILGDAVEQRYRRVIDEELKNAGYDISEKSELFLENQTRVPRFLVGGRILGLYLNTFGTSAGNYTELEATVEWQVFDDAAHKIVYETTTTDYLKLEGTRPDIYYDVLRQNIRKFLAKNGFIISLDSYLKRNPIDKRSLAKLKSILYSRDHASKPTNIVENALKAVIAIKTGDRHASGFIINKEGYALTNYHVVQDINAIDAICYDGKIIRAEVEAVLPEVDLAIIKLSGTGYDFLPLGDVNEAPIGSTIFAIGTPISIELSASVSKGIISGYRKQNGLVLVQTDASVNPGNSGGPIIDETGKVLGIVTLRLAKYDVEGLGFAISINDVIAKLGLSLSRDENKLK